MAKKRPREYKDYLHSCNVEDVSPRVLRRLNYSFAGQQRQININFGDSDDSNAEYVHQNTDIEVPNNEHQNRGIEIANIDGVQKTTTNNFDETREIIADDVGILQMISDSEIITNDDNEMSEVNNIDQLITKDVDEITARAFPEDFHVLQEVITGDEMPKVVADVNNSDANAEICCRKSEFAEWDSDLYNDLKDDESDTMNDEDISRSRNLQDFMSHKDFLGNIEIVANKSREEIFLMVLEKSLRYRSSLSEISETLRLINTIFSRTILPDTPLMCDNIINPKTNLELYGICQNCCKYLGRINNLKSKVTCEVCLEETDFNGLSCLNGFLIFDPSESIKLLLEENYEFYDYIMKERKYNRSIRDIYDGIYYKSFRKSLPATEKYSFVTAVINTDGAPRFECSQYSVWPLYLQLNEVPIEIRLKRVITCGIWFGKNKPEMTAFLQPFTETITRLSTEGIKCIINNEERLIKMYALVCCVDSVARAPMQGVKLFNGKFGCNWCFHAGEWYKGSMRYNISQSHVGERTMKNMIDIMTEYANNGYTGDVYGVKEVSPLINLPCFDIVKGFVPDYMHCCLSGVGKQITIYFLKCIQNSKIKELNQILLDIKVPHQLSRSTRCFDDMSDWKATEWQNFILYYSLPLFRFILSEKLIKYWTLFVQSLYTLLKSDITFDEIIKADEELHKFVFLTEKYFSKKAMTYNIHQLTHISESVLNWGPLWSHSTFPFEAANHDTLQAIHSAKGVNLQIVRFINIQRNVQTLRKNIFPFASPLVIDYCKKLTVKRIKKSLKVSSISYLGKGQIVDSSVLQNVGMCVKSTLSYERMVKNGCLFMSSKKKNKRSDNSFAQLLDKTFIRILDFLVDDKNKRELTICNIVNTLGSICNHIISVRNIGNEIIAVETEKISQICVFIKIRKNCYIATLPNNYHYS